MILSHFSVKFCNVYSGKWLVLFLTLSPLFLALGEFEISSLFKICLLKIIQQTKSGDLKEED